MELALFIFVLLIVSAYAATNVVLVYNKNGQLVTSSTLGWQSYTDDVKQLEYAVQSGQITTEDDKYSMYVCRVPIEGIYTAGHTTKHSKDTVCIVSMHLEVRTHFKFDLLINKGNGSKLTWKSWSKFTGSIPIGAISAVSAGHVSFGIIFNYLSYYEFI